MIKKMNKKDLIVINDLVRISTASSDDKIIKYIIDLDKEKKTLFVEIFQPSGKYAVCLRKQMKNITKDELIPIADSTKFNDILTKVIEGDEVDISVKNNEVLIKASKDNIGDNIHLPYFEEDDNEKESRENVKTAFQSRRYGDKNNILTFYGKANKEDTKPDAECKIDLKKLNIKNITDVFDKGVIEISIEEDVFRLSVGGGKQKQNLNMNRTVKKKDSEDPMTIKGECNAFIQDANCFSLLSNYSGLAIIDMKKDFPVVIKKKISEYKIGICYLISQLEKVEEE